jgi:HEAT repeat protein
MSHSVQLICKYLLVLSLSGVVAGKGLADDTDDSVSDLIAVLRDQSKDETERVLAALRLQKIGRPAAKAAPALVEVLEAEDAHLRFFAADALSSVGFAEEHRELVVQALRKRLGDSNEGVKAAALMAIGELNVADPGFVSPLTECLRSPDAQVRGQSAFLLGDIGRGARGATRELIAAMIEGRVREATAWYALGEIGPQAAYYLLKLARDERPIVAKRVAEGLRYVLGFTVPMPPRLLAEGDPLLDSDPVVRRAGMIHLALTHREIDGTVASLVKALEDEDREVRIYACLAIGHVGERATSVIPALRARLSDRDPDMRWAAAAALGGIGPEARSAIDDLRRLQEDPVDLVRSAADRAVRQVIGEDVKSEFEGLTPGNVPPDTLRPRRIPRPPARPRVAPMPQEGSSPET